MNITVRLKFSRETGKFPATYEDTYRRFLGLAGRPVLYVAAERDGMVSRASAEALFMRAPEPKTFVTVASDHTYAGEHARAAVLAWLNERHPR